MTTNFGAAADDYVRHRTGFPDSMFDRLHTFGIGREGQLAVDLGTGTGALARGLAHRGCRVTGIDPDSRMLERAVVLDRDAGVKVTYRTGSAERSGLPDDSADLVTAGQCWHWFDGQAAAAEIARILRPDGLLAVCHFDWLPLAGNMVEATESLIEAHNPEWSLGGRSGLYPAWFRDLAQAGFGGIESFSYDLLVPFTHQGWRGRIRSSAAIGASLSPADIERFDREHAAMLAARFPEDPLPIPHRVFAIVACNGATRSS